MQARLIHAPSDKIYPKHHPANDGKTRMAKPGTRGGIGNPDQDGKLFGIQCLIALSLLNDLAKADTT